ncbi:MAG: SRPBCC family protein [Acidobacteriota bacterium]|nr:SRPBCC family protein [Acidobacteriota bacterium]
MRQPTSYTHSFRLPADRRAVFDLFADPRLLDQLTPGWFRLQPTGAVPERLGAGIAISYRLRWRGLPFRWTSLLTEWQAPEFIAYEQRRGPFRFFRHEHVFETVDGGTEVCDRVIFLAPGGALADRFIAGPDLRRIFAYRERQALALLRDR